MKSTIFLSSLFAVAATAQFMGGDRAQGKPREVPVAGSITSQGCFSSKGDLKKQDGIDNMFLTVNSCAESCEKGDFAVGALSPQGCYCGNSMPPKDAIVPDPECDSPCPGYALEACGGNSDGDLVFSVINLGMDLSPPASGGKSGDEDNGDSDSDDNDDGDEDDKTSSATGGSSSSSVTGTSTSTVTTTSAASPEGTGATTTASTPSETTSSSEEADEGENASGGDEEEGGEGDAGSTLGRSMAVVAAVAGGSAWFML